ncbi:MAG: Flp pilus assembly complex ATPase component TadA [Lentisphaerae bacterium]|jgi:type II secretory ATPase GspE/PulE/Tfp pilus assembly ATPase PilB-like protein|nr:Flp pilus assembly complex ATPase component TadA [Lentisphaerota bacterium]MBT4815375.1 Flp pilus assembly complex ATPase component TadA [Lentisphaerota bacterium]MBT5609248.1 Flp pilus assembly complex ATPase component TadA [Lentisphaerota bacterium]MBT7059873.1 Flp pilus assembly complex ATPase component TadA [Lentisphaerota bacterium]MBT7847106.1 Flp pilus assembly complex ATPase component TadA [Lentisphaerota bacterium]
MSNQERSLTGSGDADLLALLVTQGDLTEDQAEQARRRMRRASVPCHQAIIDLGFTSQEAVYRALSECSGLPFTVLATQEISEDATKRVPAKIALHYKFVPISLERGTLTAAFSDPPSMRDRQNLRLLLGLRLEPIIATPSEVGNTLKNVYGLGAETVIQLRQDKGYKKTESAYHDSVSGESLEEDDDDETASITGLVNQILLEAVEMETTDIHIEPFEDTIRLRYRIDGMLREIPTPPGMHDLHEAIISRMKIMANLNIAERRLPHDGRIRVNVGEDGFDLRVSIMPTRFGETICLRILNRSAIFLEMSELGLGRLNLAILDQLVGLPHGIILVTGPTGSGKTTTLYAALAQVKEKNPERKIITVEDPIEYVLQGTTQVQMRANIGLTFASGLRSILRHDPDIVLVGEIRDGETAEIAIRSALTGHLVLSTLHTNDSVGAVNRLVDMGIEPYLVASSLVASMAQRLVRRICRHCKEEEEVLSRRIRSEIARSLDVEPDEVQAWRGAGCSECNYSGYRGRVAIYEFFLLDEELQDMVSAHSRTSELRKAALERGMRTLREDGWAKVAQGLTTIEEVQRITSTFQISYDALEDDE